MATRALRLVRRHVQIESEPEGNVWTGIWIGVGFSLICWAAIGYGLWRIL